jgi:hypothetical protein
MIAVKCNIQGVIKIMRLGIQYDDLVHYKLKVIAAYKKKSLSKYMIELFDKAIADWEKEHGVIEIPE